MKVFAIEMKKWPLHPKPSPHQSLYSWIMKLAKEYDVSYYHFCKKVLNLTEEEIDNLPRSIPEEALLTLSNGTGIAVEVLRKNMKQIVTKNPSRE